MSSDWEFNDLIASNQYCTTFDALSIQNSCVILMFISCPNHLVLVLYVRWLHIKRTFVMQSSSPAKNNIPSESLQVFNVETVSESC